MVNGIMGKVLDCSLEVSEFELQQRYYIHFRTNTLEEKNEPPCSLALGYITITAVFL